MKTESNYLKKREYEERLKRFDELDKTDRPGHCPEPWVPWLKADIERYEPPGTNYKSIMFSNC